MFALCVGYAGLHIICFHCDQYGHRNAFCTKVKPSTGPSSQTPLPTDPNGPDVCQASTSLGNHYGVGSAIGFGPWMIPCRYHRPRQPLPACNTTTSGTDSIIPRFLGRSGNCGVAGGKFHIISP